MHRTIADSKRQYERWMADPAARREDFQPPGELIDHLQNPRARPGPEKLIVPDAAFARWRFRAIHAADESIAPLFRQAVLHAPFAIELSVGCSVGCSFCCLAAARLRSA